MPYLLPLSQPSPLPDFCPLPAHLVQAPALLPALLFLDDAAPRTPAAAYREHST